VFDNGFVQNIKIDVDNLKNEILNDGGNVFVRNFPIRRVEISGSVHSPGTYTLNEGDKLSDLIKRAGGYLPNSYQFGGVLENEQALKANVFARDELYRSLLSSIVESSTAMQPGTFEATGALLRQLKESPVSGRVVTEFDLKKLESNPENDIILHDKDRVFIPEKINHVYLYGEISNQGTIQYQKNKGVDFYIDQKGGTLSRADLDNIFILHPNGVSERLQRRNVFRDGRSEIVIYPGSIIFIPRRSDRILLTQSLQAYSSILSSLGISLASVSVLKD
jgi:Periplasmic protein involved in polysaccharide export